MEWKIGCLVMAAGNASRFHANKLAAEFDGKSLIRRTFEAIPKQTFAKVTVVTQYPQIMELAKEFGFEAIENAYPDWGISYTIGLGTEHMQDCDGILYLVSDQPLLSKDSIARVVAQWKKMPDHIVGAAHNGKRGNPNLFAKKFFPKLMELREDRGGNQIIKANPEWFYAVEVAEQELTDVDTPKALQELSTAKPEKSQS